MSANAERFADRVKARMRELGLRTHDDVYAAGGPTSPVMTALLNARRDTLSPSTAKKLEAALQLMPGSATLSFEDDVELRLRDDEQAEIDELKAQVAALEREIAERTRNLRPRTRPVVSDAPGEIRTIPDHSTTQP